jgi:hypothetical protein
MLPSPAALWESFVDGTYCGQLRVAYDFSSHRIVDYRTVEPALRESIIREYGVTAEELKANCGDVFKWRPTQVRVPAAL